MIPIIAPAAAPLALGALSISLAPTPLELLLVLAEIACGIGALLTVRRVNRRAVLLYGRSSDGVRGDYKEAA